MIDLKKIADAVRVIREAYAPLVRTNTVCDGLIAIANELDPPEPKPKPLLADAKVGDLCKRRDGKYVQIIRIDTCHKYPYRYRDNEYVAGERGVTVTGSWICDDNDKRSLDIIHTEPLAPEGSAEWAWQMMLLGKKVTHIGLAESRAYYCADDIKQMLVEPNGEETPFDWDRDRWCKCNYQTGWQLYEPEQETQYKVGDWVEYRVDSQIYYGEISDIRGHAYYLSVTTEDIPPDHRLNTRTARAIRFENIVRKLNPSEVIVKIGCLEGTVKLCVNENICPDSTVDNPCHFILQNPVTGYWSAICFKELDTPTRELVESLLRAQQKGE